MQMFTDVLLVVTIAAGAFCQRIELANPLTESPCTSNARSGKDKLKIDVNIIGDISGALAQDYIQLFAVRIIQYASGVSFILCTVNMTVTPCEDASFKYCTCYPEQGRMRIAAAIPLKTMHSKGVLRAEWLRDFAPAIYSPNYTFPQVYDPSSASLTATINGVPGEAQSTRCSFEMTLYRSQILKVCCNSNLMPCYVKIVINDQEIAKDVSPCYSYSSNVDVIGVVSVSYSVCVKTEYDNSNKCSLPKVIPTTSTTSTTTTTTTSLTTPTITIAWTTGQTGIDGLTTDNSNGPTGVDEDEKTTDGTALTTRAAKEVNASDLEILYWIILAIVVLTVILAALVYCMTTRRSSSRIEAATRGPPPAERPTPPPGRPIPPAQRPTPPPGRPIPPAQRPTPTASNTQRKIIIEEERISMESASVAETGTDV